MTKKFTAALAGSATVLLLAAPIAHAEPQYAPTMVILDASGSMQRPDPGGPTMMDAAKRATRTFVAAAPATAKVGLMTYGTSTGNTEADKAAGCRDVSVLHRPDTLDKAGLTAAVDGITPRGWTPMGVALRQAAETLPKEGPRSIVLVSDGDDTCAPPDPCDVARELKQQGTDIVMHAIGFAVDPRARAQLTCMAHVTGGTYTDAPDGAALNRLLPRISASAMRGYKPAGLPIAGARTYRDAPKAVPGQYLDTIGHKEKRYYAVDVPDGATAYFSATMSFPRWDSHRDVAAHENNTTLNMRVYGEDGRDCHKFDYEQATSSNDGVALTVASTFDGATKKKQGGVNSYGNQCRAGGTYYFTVEWDAVPTGAPERAALELLVGVEPGVSDSGHEATSSTTTFVSPVGAARPVVGGGSFNVATTLDGGGVYSDTLQRGELVFYRVHLDWGQGLSYKAHLEAAGGRGLEDLSSTDTTLYSPIREELDWDFSSYTGSDQTLPTSKNMGTVPIRYANRQADDAKLRRQSVAGWYYIAVKMGTARDKSAVPIPMRLELTVTGNPEPGPRYLDGSGDVFGEKTVQQPGHSSGVGPPAAAGTHTADGKDDSKDGIPVAVWAIIAAAVVGVGGGTGLVLIRRRKGA